MNPRTRTVHDWPGRRRAKSTRQWPALQATVSRAAAVDAVEGLIVLGSFADGSADELSDIDLLAVAAPGRFADAWAKRHELAGDALFTWESRASPDPQLAWFTWLTRDVVKVECGIVDPTAARRELAEPFAVVLGHASLADRFPRIPLAVVQQRAELVGQQQQVFDPDDMTDGERIDWKISELKHAVRDALGRRR